MTGLTEITWIGGTRVAVRSAHESLTNQQAIRHLRQRVREEPDRDLADLADELSHEIPASFEVGDRPAAPFTFRLMHG